MSPKNASNAFYNGELEAELRRIGDENYAFFSNEDREKCMDTLVQLRRKQIYPHEEDECSESCRNRGNTDEYN